MAFIDKEKLRNKADAETASEHPLLKKRPMSAAERTAYLQGCVLAALVDDAQVSSEEHRLIRTIGLSLNFADNEIEDTFNIVAGLRSEDDKLSLVDDIVSLLKVEPMRGYFLDDFKRVIESGDVKNGDAMEIYDLIGARLYEDENWQNKRSLAKKKANEEKSLRTLDKELAQAVEEGMRWPEVYDRDKFIELTRCYGVKEHQVTKLLSLLLPHARKAYEGVRASIGQMECYVDHDRHYLNMLENEHAVKFLNYVKCMNDCAALNEDYAIIRGVDSDGETLKADFDFFWVSLEQINYSHRRNGAAQEARRELLNLYKSLLDEFENMSKF